MRLSQATVFTHDFDAVVRVLELCGARTLHASSNFVLFDTGEASLAIHRARADRITRGANIHLAVGSLSEIQARLQTAPSGVNVTTLNRRGKDVLAVTDGSQNILEFIENKGSSEAA